MPDSPNNAHNHSWATKFTTYTQLSHNLIQAAPHKMGRIEEKVAALVDDLLATPAPTLIAVRQKLELLWEAKLHGLDQGSKERCLILKDLEDLIRAEPHLPPA